jgi:hypothetical protein
MVNRRLNRERERERATDRTGGKGTDGLLALPEGRPSRERKREKEREREREREPAVREGERES